MSPQRINVTIDRIITDDPSLDRAILMQALQVEIRTRLRNDAALGAPGARASSLVRMEPSTRPLFEQIAQATLRGLNR